MIKVVMCVGTWPEDNYEDFVVTHVQEGESDEAAIKRAAEYYSEDDEFYIDYINKGENT